MKAEWRFDLITFKLLPCGARSGEELDPESSPWAKKSSRDKTERLSARIQRAEFKGGAAKSHRKGSTESPTREEDDLQGLIYLDLGSRRLRRGEDIREL